MLCDWCTLKEGISIGKKNICWDCANMMAKSGSLKRNEKMYLQMRFRREFGEKEEINK